MLFIILATLALVAVAYLVVKVATNNSNHIPTSIRDKLQTMPVPDKNLPNVGGNLAEVQKTFKNHVPDANAPPMTDYNSVKEVLKEEVKKPSKPRVKKTA